MKVMWYSDINTHTRIHLFSRENFGHFPQGLQASCQCSHSYLGGQYHHLYKLKLLSNIGFYFFTSQWSSQFRLLNILSILATTGHCHLGHSYSTGHSASRLISLPGNPHIVTSMVHIKSASDHALFLAMQCSPLSPGKRPEGREYIWRSSCSIRLSAKTYLVSCYSPFTLCLEKCWLAFYCTLHAI